MSDRLEKQHREEALQRYLSQADELDQWLSNARFSLGPILEPGAQDEDLAEQLVDCQVRAPPTGCLVALCYSLLNYSECIIG